MGDDNLSQAPVPSTEVAGPVVPSPAVREELADALRNDGSALGEVFRQLEAGKSLAEVRHDIGDYAWNYNRAFRAILDADLPTAPAVLRQTQRPFRRLLRDVPSLSPEAEASLRTNLAAVEARLAEIIARTGEIEDAHHATDEAEAEAIPGIYVYALPHYLNYPVDPVSGHTLLKVGRSDRNVIQRFRQQIRTTALPEDPLLLRIYESTAEDALRQEGQFHSLLEAADHTRSTARAGGTEWFMTSLRFLDAVANTIGLKIHTVFDPEAPE